MTLHIQIYSEEYRVREINGEKNENENNIRSKRKQREREQDQKLC